MQSSGHVTGTLLLSPPVQHRGVAKTSEIIARERDCPVELVSERIALITLYSKFLIEKLLRENSIDCRGWGYGDNSKKH
jgi:hypothetical protein